MLFSSISPAITIFKKDLRSELRTRYSLNSLLMFVITTLSVILFAIGNENVSTDVLSGVLWIIIFFSTMSGLSRHVCHRGRARYGDDASARSETSYDLFWETAL